MLALGIMLTTLACVRHAEAITPRRLVEVADLSSPVVSPDGRRVAFRLEQAAIERNTFDTAWYVQDVDGTASPSRVADGGFALHAYHGLSSPVTAVWSPDGRWIYYRAMIDGKIDVWRAAADGSAAEAVTLDAADVRDFFLSDDGRTLTYSVGAPRDQVAEAEKTEYERGVRVDKTVPIGQALFRSGYIDGHATTQRYLNGRELVRAGLLADAVDRWKAIDLATGRQQDVSLSDLPKEPTADPAQHSTGSEPWKRVADHQRNRVALLTRSGDGEGLYRKPYSELAVLLDRKARHSVRCQADPCRDKAITDALWRPDSDELLFTVTDLAEGQAQSIFAWDVRSNAVRPVVRARGLVNGGRDVPSSCGISARALVCVAAEADRPPRLERIDLETGARRDLFDPNAALAMDIAAATPARFLRWKDASGRLFTGQFFPARRSDGSAAPLFVNYYGCAGFVRGGTGDEWPLVSLAEQGIAALCINYAPLPLDAVERYDQGLSAVRSAIDLLASAGEIDRNRVGMGGLSLGAEVTLWTVVNSRLIAAASVSSPVHTPFTYGLRNIYEDTFLPALEKFWQLRSPAETPERWRRLSPVFSLDEVRAPIIMQIPEQEYLLSLEYAVPLIKKGRAELWVFADEPHIKFLPKHKLAIYERNLDWFKFWLLGEEDSDVSKREQYARWRSMKERGSSSR